MAVKLHCPHLFGKRDFDLQDFKISGVRFFRLSILEYGGKREAERLSRSSPLTISTRQKLFEHSTVEQPDFPRSGSTLLLVLHRGEFVACGGGEIVIERTGIPRRHALNVRFLIRRFLIAIGQPGQSQWQRKRD
jgi:hypothetical protein